MDINCITESFGLSFINVRWVSSPVSVQLDGGVGEHAQHEADGGAVVAVDAKERRLVVPANHHQVARAARVRALQFHRLPPPLTPITISNNQTFL